MYKNIGPISWVQKHLNIYSCLILIGIEIFSKIFFIGTLIRRRLLNLIQNHEAIFTQKYQNKCSNAFAPGKRIDLRFGYTVPILHSQPENQFELKYLVGISLLFCFFFCLCFVGFHCSIQLFVNQRIHFSLVSNSYSLINYRFRSQKV